MDLVKQVRDRFRVISPLLDERGRRISASMEAQSFGWGGVSNVAEATGLARTTLHRGLVELEKLIAHTTTRKGLKVTAILDSKDYPTGIKVSDDVYASLNIKRAQFHGDWNYAILPRQ